MPDKLTQIIPKERPVLPAWIRVVFFLSLAMLIAFIPVAFLLNSKISHLKQKKALLKEQIQALYQVQSQRTSVKDLQRQQDQIKALQTVLREHKAVSKVIPWFASLIHKKVQVTSLAIDVSKKQITFSGVAPSPKVAGEQFLILEQDPDVAKATLSPLSLSQEDTTEFNITFSFPGKIMEIPEITALLPEEPVEPIPEEEPGPEEQGLPPEPQNVPEQEINQPLIP